MIVVSGPFVDKNVGDKPMMKSVLSWLVTIILLTIAPIARAQQPAKIFRIGFLDSGTASGSAALVDAFRQELSKLGWIEAKNVTIEYRFAEQSSERMACLRRSWFD